MSTPKPTINLIERLASLRGFFTKIRSKETSRQDFLRYSKRLMHMICEEAIATLNPTPKTITTPTEGQYTGFEVCLDSIVAISIIRAADSMLGVFMDIVPEAAVGKILIQRDEATAQPVLYYSKLPPLENKVIVVLDPMLATGGSAICAIEVLIKAGASEENITFANVVTCPEGIAALNKAYPKVQIITGEIDPALDEKKYIIPGLGDFGDRFFGTV